MFFVRIIKKKHLFITIISKTIVQVYVDSQTAETHCHDPVRTIPGGNDTLTHNIEGNPCVIVLHYGARVVKLLRTCC